MEKSRETWEGTRTSPLSTNAPLPLLFQMTDGSAPKRQRGEAAEEDFVADDDGEAEIRQMIASLLTNKERITDGLLVLLSSRDDDGDFAFYDGVSEDDKQALVESARDKLGALSPVVCSKILPLVVKKLTEEHERRVSASYGRIRTLKKSTACMAKMYRTAFRQWTDSPFVSFVAGNAIQLGGLAPKEAFVLHVYAFMGCYRTKADDCYALAVTGETSVGKSLVFENPFSANAHQFLNQEGCGRWNVGRHSLVMYHDVSLSVLLRPSECETFKTLARTEMSASKVFAGSAYLPPLFLLVTSNQRVHAHEVADPTRELRERVRRETEEAASSGKKVGRQAESKQLLLPSWKPASSRPSQSTKPALRRALVLESNMRAATVADSPNVRALQSRILEAHCYQRPELDPWCVPRGEKFTRAHVLLGTSEYALSILEARQRTDFYSWPLASYVLTTLCMSIKFYAKNMEDGPDFESRLRAVLERLEPDPEERMLYTDLF